MPRSCHASRRRSQSSTRASPEVGRNSVASSRSSVVLPAPLGPSTTMRLSRLDRDGDAGQRDPFAEVASQSLELDRLAHAGILAECRLNDPTGSPGRHSTCRRRRASPEMEDSLRAHPARGGGGRRGDRRDRAARLRALRRDDRPAPASARRRLRREGAATCPSTLPTTARWPASSCSSPPPTTCLSRTSPSTPAARARASAAGCSTGPRRRRPGLPSLRLYTNVAMTQNIEM